MVALRARVEADLASLVSSQRDAQSSAVHAEARAEDDKDTRAIESSYLARGLAERVALLSNEVAALRALHPRRFGDDDAISVGALVEVRVRAGSMHYFIAPVAGGVRVRVGDATVTSVTPTAPLGRALIGQRADDEVEVETPDGRQSYEIVAVR